MGSDHSQDSTFRKEEWDLVQRTTANQLWRSRKDPNFHIEQYQIYARDNRQQSEQSQSFKFRYRQPQLVSSIFYKGEEQHQFCSSSHTNTLFLQKIPIRLSDIQHIPFPDSLHLYSQSLLGFQLISNKYGFFQIQEEHVGVNEKAIVKVWCNNNFSKSFITGGKISEEQMVKSLVDILDKNCDPNLPGNVPTIRNYLYRNADTLHFDQAIQELKSYSLNYNQGYIPERLECVERVGGIYAIANRVSVQTDLPETGRSLQPQRRSQENVNYPGYERPRIISDHSLPSQHFIPYRDNNQNRQVSSQFNLKASEALPTSTRQQVIIDPNAYRENVQIIRKGRRSNEGQGQGGPFQQIQPQRENPMRYSQTVQFVQPRPFQSPVKSSQINFSTQPQTAQIQQLNKVPSDYNQVAFKGLSQQQRESTQPLQIGNSSILNYNNGHSQSNTKIGQNFSVLGGNSFNQNSQNFVPQRPQGQSQRQQQQLLRPIQSQLQQAPQRVEVQQRSEVPQHQKQIQLPLQQQGQVQVLQQQQGIQPQKVQHDQANQNLQLSQAPFKRQTAEVPQQIQVTQKKESFQTQNLVQLQPSKEIQSPNIQQSPSKPQSFQSVPQGITQLTAQQPQYQASYGNTYNATKSPSEFTKKSYHELNPDDGKSSEEFMKKLREITQGISSHSQIKAQNNSEQTYQASAYSSTNQPPYTGLQPEVNYAPGKYSYQAGSIQPTSISADDEDFGRVAVSNIIQSHQPSFSKMSAFSNQPLKFENNLAMKYSVLEADEPEKSNVSKGSYGKYDMKLDADLMADLRKIKE